MKRITCLCVILHVKHKKITTEFWTFLRDFYSLVKSKMAIMFGDVTFLQQRHHRQNIPHLVGKIKGFALKVKSFRYTQLINNSREGFHQHQPPPPSCTTLGV